MKSEQMLIQQLKVEKSKALNNKEELRQQMELANEKARAFDLAIDKVELLFKQQLKEDIEPPLLKTHVKRSLPPYDGELLKRLWAERNPQHETNADTGENMFYRTVYSVLADYMQLAGGNDA